MTEIVAFYVKIVNLKQSHEIDLMTFVFNSYLEIKLGEDKDINLSSRINVKYRINEVATIDHFYAFTNNCKIKVTNRKLNTSEEIENEIIFKTICHTKFIFPRLDDINIFGFHTIETSVTHLLNSNFTSGIVLYGPNGCGKKLFLKKLEQDFAWKHFIQLRYTDLNDAFYIGNINRKIKMLHKNIVLCITDLERIINKDSLNRITKLLNTFQEMKSMTVTVIITCENIKRTDKMLSFLITHRFAVNLIGREDKWLYLKHLIQTKTDRSNFEPNLESFSLSLSGYSANDIKAFISKVYKIYPELTLEQLESYKNSLDSNPPKRLIEFISKIERLRWSEIGGYESVKQELIDNIQEPILYGGRIAKGVLLYGPPGCSKTMFARALATECQLNSFVITPSTILHKKVGVSEAKLQQILQIATDSAPSLIFIDEIDILLPNRSTDSDNVVATRLLGVLLSFIDGIENKSVSRVIFMAATNKIHNVDEALMRVGRIDLRIKIDFPDQHSRESILKIVLADPDIKVDSDVIDSIPSFAAALAGKSGADIVEFCKQVKRVSLNVTKNTVVEVLERLSGGGLSQKMALMSL